MALRAKNTIVFTLTVILFGSVYWAVAQRLTNSKLILFLCACALAGMLVNLIVGRNSQVR